MSECRKVSDVLTSSRPGCEPQEILAEDHCPQPRGEELPNSLVLQGGHPLDSLPAVPESFLLLLLSHFSVRLLCDPTDGSPPGSAVPGFLQARTLEWVAICFSNAWKWKVKLKTLSRVRLLAYQAPPSMGFSRQEYWSGLPLLSPESFLEASKLTSLNSYFSVFLFLANILVLHF